MRARRRWRRGWDERTATGRWRRAVKLGCGSTSAKELAVGITIKLVSIPVDDQAKALEFYTEKFGFEKRADVSQGDYRWLTVTAPEGSPDVELVLEPNANPASKSYQESLREQGIPITSFFSNDLDADYERLVGLGVTFTKEPTRCPGASSQFSTTPAATSSSCSR